MAFTKEIKGFREVDTRVGDTVQKISLRELSDTGRWYEIVNLNGLLPPYLTSDIRQVTDAVILSGSTIKIPSNNLSVSAETEVNDIFGTDIKLNRGRIEYENGDIKTISSISNLVQALRHKIITEPGELLFYPFFGCDIYSLIGNSSGPVNALVAKGFVGRTIKSDKRVNNINKASVVVEGDSIAVEIEAEAVNGREFLVSI